ncbi:MAG TPA: hypothetical protein VKZ53_08250 [Candidatus Angelobacter sp.]|nr:hypothetical protein [Candidatus Angelobacter sp.]
MTFKTGDVVRITFNGKTVTGEVFLASENGLSLTLMFDEYLGGYLNLMPVLWLDDSYVDLLLAEPVTINSLPTC